MKPEVIAFVPSLPEPIAQRWLPSQDIAINSINLSIEELNKFVRLLPSKYGWRFKTVEALRAEMRGLPKKSPIRANQLYWTDILKTCEAYTVMASWRIVELSRSCVWGLGRDDVLCAAIVARSALETTAQFAYTSRKIAPTLEKLHSVDFSTHVIVASELENELLKTVFASKLPSSEDIYAPTNILTVLKHVSRIKGQEFVQPTHEALCEITHPNYLGRSLYILEVKSGEREGDEVRTLGLEHGPTSKWVIGLTLRSLSWACMAHVTSALMVQAAIGELKTKLG